MHEKNSFEDQFDRMKIFEEDALIKFLNFSKYPRCVRVKSVKIVSNEEGGSASMSSRNF